MTDAAYVTPVQIDGHGATRLSSRGAELSAVFLPGLGMVGASLCHAGEELLARRGGVAAYAERGSTFGIPLLAPWANRLQAWSYSAEGRHVSLDPDGPGVRSDPASGLPIHGLLAASPYWSASDARADAHVASLHAELDFGAHPELLVSFPFPHRLELDIDVRDARLNVATTLTATGSVGVPISFGFHPYLRLPGSRREDWTVALPVRRRLVLDQRGIPTGETQPVDPVELSGPLGERVFDDAYDRLDATEDERPISFSVADTRRRVSVELIEGFVAAQVYAPAGSPFICFEPMTAPVNALASGSELRLAEPGQTFRAEFAISVQALTG